MFKSSATTGNSSTEHNHNNQKLKHHEILAEMHTYGEGHDDDDDHICSTVMRVSKAMMSNYVQDSFATTPT
jgi:hypothetical protein